MFIGARVAGAFGVGLFAERLILRAGWGGIRRIAVPRVPPRAFRDRPVGFVSVSVKWRTCASGGVFIGHGADPVR